MYGGVMKRWISVASAGALAVAGALGVGGSAMADGGVRLHGSDRYATSAAVSQYGWNGGGGAVFVASGLGYADALSSVPAAIRAGAPILLVGNGISDSVRSELKRLRPSKIFVVGGMVNGAIRGELAGYGPEVVWLHGQDRYGTAIEVSRAMWPDGADTVLLADGGGYADAVSGGPLGGKLGAPILLARAGGIDGRTVDEIRRLGARKVLLLGGTVSDRGLSDMGISVERLSGADRYVTSRIIADRVGGGGAVIASGEDYPDALVAGGLGKPVRLSRNTGWHAKEGDRGGSNVIVGGQVAPGLENGRDVFLVPHQDDEALTMATGIIEAVDNGRDVWVVLLTDGSRSGAYKFFDCASGGSVGGTGGACLSRSEFAQARDREFMAALKRLGVDERKVVMNGFGAGRGQEGWSGIEEVVNRGWTQLGAVDGSSAVRWHSMSWLDEHDDHRRSGLALRELCRGAGIGVDDGSTGDCRFYQSDLYRVDVGDALVLKRADGSVVPKKPITWGDGGRIVVPSGDGAARIRASLDEYRYVNVSEGRYGIAWKYSVKSYFEFAYGVGMSDLVHGMD